MFRIIILSLLLSFSLLADVHNGEKLFNENNCIQCHAVNNLKPREHKVNSFIKLKKIVGACSFNTDTGWFDDEVMDVTHYLNENYYHFPQKK